MTVREYGTITDAERSHVTILAEAFSPRVRATVRLAAYTAGYEPAGAMMRHTDGGYAVWWEQLGARQGRRYRTEPEARAHFASLTMTQA